MDRWRVAVLCPLPDGPSTRLREAAEVVDEPEDADAIVCSLDDSVDGPLLDRAGGRLQVVANVAVGYDNVDVDAARERDVVVTNTPGVLTDATADLALALILMVTRRLAEGERLIRSGEPWRWEPDFMLGTALRGRTLGVVGLGAIGAATAARARALGMAVAYHSRSESPHAAELGAERLALADLLERADVVSLHCPLSAQTRHLIDARALARMKPTAYLVNTARGPVVDEDALVAALTGGLVAGAALDVHEHEPDVHPGLRDRDDVVLLPHLGSATVETRTAMADLAVDNVLAVLGGKDPLSPV